MKLSSGNRIHDMSMEGDTAMKEKLEKQKPVRIELSDDAMALVTGGEGGNGGLRCPICKQRFKTPKALKTHTKNSHG